MNCRCLPGVNGAQEHGSDTFIMSGITPPFALGMYAGMSIAKSDFTKTLKNDLWWVAVQYVLEVVVLLGVLPVIGL